MRASGERSGTKKQISDFVFRGVGISRGSEKQGRGGNGRFQSLVDKPRKERSEREVRSDELGAYAAQTRKGKKATGSVPTRTTRMANGDQCWWEVAFRGGAHQVGGTRVTKANSGEAPCNLALCTLVSLLDGPAWDQPCWLDCRESKLANFVFPSMPGPSNFKSHMEIPAYVRLDPHDTNSR